MYNSDNANNNNTFGKENVTKIPSYIFFFENPSYIFWFKLIVNYSTAAMFSYSKHIQLGNILK